MKTGDPKLNASYFGFSSHDKEGKPGHQRFESHTVFPKQRPDTLQGNKQCTAEVNEVMFLFQRYMTVPVDKIVCLLIQVLYSEQGTIGFLTPFNPRYVQ